MSMWSVLSWLDLEDPMSGSVTEGSGTDRWLLLLWLWVIREPRLAAEMFLGKGELCSFSSLGWLREGEQGSQRVRDTRRDCEEACDDLHMDGWRYGEQKPFDYMRMKKIICGIKAIQKETNMSTPDASIDCNMTKANKTNSNQWCRLHWMWYDMTRQISKICELAQLLTWRTNRFATVALSRPSVDTVLDVAYCTDIWDLPVLE